MEFCGNMIGGVADMTKDEIEAVVEGRAVNEHQIYVVPVVKGELLDSEQMIELVIVSINFMTNVPTVHIIIGFIIQIYINSS